MDVYPADYHDIYSEWIPSSNFANQPMDEICDLRLATEGLWTFMDSDTSSSSDDEDPQTWPARSLIQSPKPQWSPMESSVATKVEDWPLKPPLQRRRRCSSDITVTTQRSYRETAPASAPLNGSFPTDHAPQPPRRAISVRLDKPSSGRKRNSFRKSISERLRKPASGLGIADPELHGLHGRSQPRPTESHVFEVTQKPQIPESFSQKLRVRTVLHARDLGKLKTDDVCFDTKAHPDSATSMMSTPRELYYSYPRQQIRDTDFDGVSSDRSESWMPISPKAALSSVRTGVDDPHIWGRENSVRDSLAPRKKRVYMPGPIILEQHPALLRKDSVATMDAFLDDLGPKQRRESDVVVLDQIASFFDDPGVNEPATDEGLDKFWLEESLPYGQPSSRAMSVDELEAHPPWAPRSCHGQCQPSEASGQLSRFSFSSASSTVTVAPSRRQRLKLRRLWLPALPGSTFLKSAGTWGQQADSL